MKKLALFASVVVLSLGIACDQKAEQADETISTDLVNNPATASDEANEGKEKLPEIEFNEDAIEFGEISQGEKVKQRFRFKNVGNSDLIISDAKGSCGCTVPLWPKQPIRPGQEGEIEVVFNSENKSGFVNNKVTLVMNTIPNTKVIALKGTVLTPETSNN